MKKARLSVILPISAILLLAGTGVLAFSPKPIQPVNQTVQEQSAPQEAPKPADTQPAPTPELQTQPEPTAPKTEVAVAPAAPSQPAPQPLSQWSFGSYGDWKVKAGLPQNAWLQIDTIIAKESSNCAYKWEGEVGGECPAFHGVPNNPTVGYGLCQATPANKMAEVGSDWQTNPITQLKWCDKYARERYGGWAQAYIFWGQNHYW